MNVAFVGQGKKRLAPSAATGGDVPSYLVVTANVLLFVAETAEELRRQMTLLGRRLFVRGENRVDPLLMDRGQHPPRAGLGQRVRLRLRRLDRFADLAPGMAKRPGNLPNAHPVPVCTTYPAVAQYIYFGGHCWVRFLRRPASR
ncbi:MAG: hypothetical protein H0T51_16240 [Pirellulales bacterium]|nr:hypothetical protein [Pirellulales bacterium]